ncbi:MAG TPA: PPA1309 family protein [Mycobacteriales bacterium]|nr:PPA1309 family protein [Mycobacteriales bacterium]
MNAHLSELVLEIERHVSEHGWDQPPRLYALVPTAELIEAEPELAAHLGLPPDAGPEALTPVEQEPLPADAPLDDTLARIAWPEQVSGCALVQEVLMLPPEAEEQAPADADVAGWAAAHPLRRDVRLVVGVLRDGSREATVRVRAAGDGEDGVLSGPDLVPGLADALAATLEE